MISFQNLPRTTTWHNTYLPEDLKSETIRYLKQANIPYKNISWTDAAIDETQKRIMAHQYRKQGSDSNLEVMGILRTPIPSTALFHAVCQLFGKHIDPDYQTERIQKEAIAKETYETCYKPFLQEGQIPIFETR